jgi:hypothetical protein
MTLPIAATSFVLAPGAGRGTPSRCHEAGWGWVTRGTEAFPLPLLRQGGEGERLASEDEEDEGVKISQARSSSEGCEELPSPRMRGGGGGRASLGWTPVLEW